MYHYFPAEGETMRRLLWLLALSLVCLGEARAQDSSAVPQDRLDALKGLTSVTLVAKVDKCLQHYGLTEAELYKSAADRLTKAGITVRKPGGAAKQDATAPTLGVILDGHKIPGCMLVYHVQVTTCEPVRLERGDREAVQASVWREEIFGAVDPGDMRHVLQIADELVDRFVSEWSAANRGAGK
jgi:hypothetical protein